MNDTTLNSNFNSNTLRAKDLLQLKQKISHIMRTQFQNPKKHVCAALYGGVNQNKTAQRRRLECTAIAVVVAKGNAEHGFYYFEIIETLPDMILDYDHAKLFSYVFDMVVPKLTLEKLM